MRILLYGLVTVALAVASVCSAGDRPNILILLADDMGYGDLGCMGSELLQTPNLDAFAASGTLCEQAYVASAVCSPSRAGLITGRDPRRFGYQANLNKSSEAYATRPELLGLPPSEDTLGDHLRAAGYATSLVGKWHLGKGNGFHPLDRGFDYFCGMLGGSHSYFPDPKKNGLERNRKPLRTFSSPYLTDFFTDEGIGWLKGQRDHRANQPWFLFLSYNAPHGPLHATKEDFAKFEVIVDKKRRTYAAMMFALDRGVGRIRSWLRDSGQLDNTLIVFFSDNGGATNNGSWNGTLSGVKGCLREGGVRVPMIWSWPDQIPAGRTVSGVVSSLDLLPTFLAAAKSEPLGLKPPLTHYDGNNRKRAAQLYGAYDGINLLPILQQEAEAPERLLFWRLQGQAAVLDGEHKLIRLGHRPAQVFRPSSDLSERNDLAADSPEIFRHLFHRLGEWEAALPTVPLWGSSPYWNGQSAKHYDNWETRSEPK